MQTDKEDALGRRGAMEEHTVTDKGLEGLGAKALTGRPREMQ